MGPPFLTRMRLSPAGHDSIVHSLSFCRGNSLFPAPASPHTFPSSIILVGLQTHARAHKGDDGLLAAAGDDGLVRAWDMATRRPCFELEASRTAVLAVLVSLMTLLLVEASNLVFPRSSRESSPPSSRVCWIANAVRRVVYRTSLSHRDVTMYVQTLSDRHLLTQVHVPTQTRVLPQGSDASEDTLNPSAKSIPARHVLRLHAARRMSQRPWPSARVPSANFTCPHRLPRSAPFSHLRARALLYTG
jgi:hypothetical protein